MTWDRYICANALRLTAVLKRCFVKLTDAALRAQFNRHLTFNGSAGRCSFELVFLELNVKISWALEMEAISKSGPMRRSSNGVKVDDFLGKLFSSSKP